MDRTAPIMQIRASEVMRGAHRFWCSTLNLLGSFHCKAPRVQSAIRSMPISAANRLNLKSRLKG
eukprot:15472420-Alexandrium_andersonii.AAC.1